MKSLSPSERQTIGGILDEYEANSATSLSSLDNKCQELWPDWNNPVQKAERTIPDAYSDSRASSSPKSPEETEIQTSHTNISAHDRIRRKQRTNPQKKQPKESDVPPKSDPYRLKNENISLQTELDRKSKEFDRISMENSKLKEAIEKNERTIVKQRTLISYLKSRRLEGDN